MSQQNKKTILLVEDEIIIAMAQAKTIINFGYNVITANSGDEAVEIALGNETINLILMDINLGRGKSGPEAAEQILSKKNIPIVFLTSHSEKKIVEQVHGITSYGYVVKNSGDFVLHASINMAFELFEANKKLMSINHEMKLTQEALSNSEQQLRIITNNIPALISYVNAEDLKYIFVNRVFAENFGMSPEDIIGKKVKEILGNEAYSRALPYIERACNGERISYENIIPVKNNSRWFNINYIPEFNNNGAVTRLIVMVFDINERKIAAEELNIFRDLVEFSSDAIGISTPDGKHYYQNEAFNRVFGNIGDNPPETAYVDKIIGKQVFDTIKNGGTWQGEVKMYGKNQSVLDIFLRAFAIKSNEGLINRLVGLHTDITDRKRNEEILRENESKFRSVVEKSHVGIAIVNDESKYIYINEEFCKMVGYPENEILGKDFSFLLSDESRELAIDRYKRRQRGEDIPSRYEFSFIQKSGEKRIGEVRSAVYKDSLQKMNSLIQTIDITERKKIEDILRSSEEKYRFLTNNMNDIIWTMDMNFNTTYVSPSIETVLGFTVEERMKQGLAEQITPDSINKVKDIMIKEIANEQQGIGDSKKIFNYELDFNHKNGSLRTMEIIANKIRDKNGAWIGILGVSRDITERKQSEEALRNLQKLESLGVLAGGIAHDFNNLLGGIFGYIDLASSVSTEKEVIQYLNESLSTINRARALTNQLLTFSKGGAPIRKTEHLMPIIRETVQFALSGSNISHTIEIDKDLWPCYIDKNQISQVIDNIIINSLQAMPMGGKIEVTAKNIRQGNKEHSILQNTQYVKVSIKDFGIGIPKEIKPFIFDPFFTTKTKGHGLGLATSFSIVNRHEGLMDIESTPGKGTTFHIFLPASQENAINEKQKTDVSHKGSGTIIVMDDEEFIRNTLEKMLNSQGYNCVLLKDGSEVLDFFQAENKSKRQITGLILDLTIPGGLGGREIVSAIRKIDPKVPILVISGYADDPAIADPAPFGFTASIGKPFTIAELSAVLEKHLKQD